MKGNSVITVREAKTGDRGCLISRYSMSTCCVKCAKARTKDLNIKTCTSGIMSKRDAEVFKSMQRTCRIYVHALYVLYFYIRFSLPF